MRTSGFALSVLIVEDDDIVRDAHCAVLETAGIEQDLLTLSDGADVIPTIRSRDVGVVLLDLSLPGTSGERVLASIREENPHIPVVIVTGSDEIGSAVRCMKAGAFDYLEKPVEPSRLVATVRTALEMRSLQIENRLITDRFLGRNREIGPAFRSIVTQDQGMIATFKYAEAIARSPKVVLITGETGTGKELFARAIHRASGRPGELLAVNTAEFDETMFSDVLFGHRKGAYTGAEERRKGIVEAAGAGTLFLDEIGDLGLRVQAKLLRLLESGEYLPIGTDEPSRTSVRVIAATNRDLESAVADGSFRRDLFFRLSVHRVRIPPLREREGDLPLLFDHFLAKAAADIGLPSVPRYDRGVLSDLEKYDFPGNVRELENLVYDAVSGSPGGTLDGHRFRDLPRRSAPHTSPETGGSAGQECSGDQFPRDLPSARELQDRLYRAAMERTGGSQSAAARLIGVSQQTLSNWARRNRPSSEDHIDDVPYSEGDENPDLTKK